MRRLVDVISRDDLEFCVQEYIECSVSTLNFLFSASLKVEKGKYATVYRCLLHKEGVFEAFVIRNTLERSFHRHDVPLGDLQRFLTVGNVERSSQVVVSPLKRRT